MQTFKYVVILQYLFFILFFIINLISKHLFKWNTNNLYFGAIKNWARTVLHWNFATDVNCMSSLRFSSLLFCSFPFPSMLCYFLLFTCSICLTPLLQLGHIPEGVLTAEESSLSNRTTLTSRTTRNSTAWQCSANS